MAIINERISSLALPRSDCAALNKKQLDELLSAVKPVIGNPFGGVVMQNFSVADLQPEGVIAKLKSLDIAEKDVLVCWPAFAEGFRMRWSVFLAHLDDLWYPSSDDVIVISSKGLWALELTHEETVRLLRLKTAKQEEIRKIAFSLTAD